MMSHLLRVKKSANGIVDKYLDFRRKIPASKQSYYVFLLFFFKDR